MFKIFKGEKKNKKLWQLVGLIFLVGAVISGVVLVKQSQDIREKAGSEDECTSTADCAEGYRCSGIPKQCVKIEGEDDSDKEGKSECLYKNNPPCSRSSQDADCCTSDGRNGYCAYKSADDTALVCHASGGGGSGDQSGSGGGSRSGNWLSRLPKCNADNPCAEGMSCSTRFKRCFTNNRCERWDKFLKCQMPQTE